MTSKEKVYYLFVFIFCVISIVFAVLDFTKGLTREQQIADWTIYGMFVADYVIRFIMADGKKAFVKANIFDLLAILPLNSAFRAFRLFRFAKLLRLTKLFRVGALSGRFVVRSRKFLDTNGFKYVLIISGAAILLAAVGMAHFEGMKFTDALWWSFVTATTVGYGDLAPVTGMGRTIACFLMLVGIGLLGALTSTITSFFLKTISNEPSNEKVDMVVTLYDKLNDEEKKMFKDVIS